MPYQSVGRPRFWINIVEWAESTGAMGIGEMISLAGEENLGEHYRTLPVIPKPHISDTINLNLPANIELINPFVAILGHNLDVNLTSTEGFKDDFVNGYPASTNYFGYSIISLNDTPTDLGFGDDDGIYYDIGSIIYGSYYTMPQNADLNITMSREMDGVKTIRMLGGTDLVNHKYTKSPKWGSLSAWELGYEGDGVSDWETNFQGTGQNLSRQGRRVWDMSFSFVADKDLFGSNQSLALEPWGSQQTHVASGVMEAGDLDGGGFFRYDLISDNNFYSQVIHFTGGGRLPFIFQPDINDNLNWAICKFQNISFQRQSLGLYSVKCKIREVW